MSAGQGASAACAGAVHGDWLYGCLFGWARYLCGWDVSLSDRETSGGVLTCVDARR